MYPNLGENNNDEATNATSSTTAVPTAIVKPEGILFLGDFTRTIMCGGK